MSLKKSQTETMEIFKKHFSPGGLSSASLKFFLETGEISGELYIALKEISDTAYIRGMKNAPICG